MSAVAVVMRSELGYTLDRSPFHHRSSIERDRQPHTLGQPCTYVCGLCNKKTRKPRKNRESINTPQRKTPAEVRTRNLDTVRQQFYLFQNTILTLI